MHWSAYEACLSRSRYWSQEKAHPLSKYRRPMPAQSGLSVQAPATVGYHLEGRTILAIPRSLWRGACVAWLGDGSSFGRQKSQRETRGDDHSVFPADPR